MENGLKLIVRIIGHIDVNIANQFSTEKIRQLNRNCIEVKMWNFGNNP